MSDSSTNNLSPQSEHSVSRHGRSNGQELVFALGSLGYDFGTDAVLDSFKFFMKGIRDQDGKEVAYPNPHDPFQLVAYLQGQKQGEHTFDEHLYDTERLIWLVKHNDTPVYAIKPTGAYAIETYNQLLTFIKRRERMNEGNSGIEAKDAHAVQLDLVSIPGAIIGDTKLATGQVVPVIEPNLRGMINWSDKNIFASVMEQVGKSLTDDEKKKLLEAVENVVNRIFYEVQNFGRTSADRALNYGITTLYTLGHIIDSEVAKGHALQSIRAEKSPISRPNSDCQDVEIRFFPNERGKPVTCYRVTVDVSQVIPVSVGDVRMWYDDNEAEV